MKNPKVRQVVLPLITALIWGSAFVTQSLSAAHLGCFSFNALRAIPAVLVLLVLLAVMQRIHPREKYSAEEKRALLRVSGACDQLAAVWQGDDERGQGGLYHGALHRARAGVQHGAWQKGEEKHLALRDRRRRGALLPVL